MQKRNHKKKRKARKTRGFFQDMMRYRGWEDSPGRGYSGLLKRWWEDDAAWLKKPNRGFWGLLRRLQKKRKQPYKSHFGSDQKYYDCFAKIWGWNGCKKDPAKGIEELECLLKGQAGIAWDKKAPFDPDLQFEVGVAYLSGWLTSINSNEPLLWFSRSAKQGAPRGLLAMGYLYEKGRWGCRCDPVEMLSYYRKAANLGSAPAMYRLARIALELKLDDRDNILGLLTQAAPEYRPAKILLAREFPDVANSRKYRKLYTDEWDDIAEEPVPAVELKSKRKMKKLIQMDEDEFAELEDEFEPTVKPTPVLGWRVNSDPDEVYPWEDETWSSQAPAVEETVTELDPELEEIFSRFFGNEKNTETEEAAPKPDWKNDTAILPPLEELLEPKKYAAGKENGIVFDLQETEEKRESVDPLVQQLLQEFRDFKETYRKDQEQGRAEHKKLQQTAERIDKNTRHIEKIVVGNQELLISLDVSVKILQSSLQGMWSELKKTEAAFREKLDELQKQVQSQLNRIPQEELKNAEEFMALIFLGDWRKPGRLSNESCDALVAARVLMKAAENLGVKNYAGVVISAVWALEYECRRRFRDAFDSYLESLGVQQAQIRAERMHLTYNEQEHNAKFTLGSTSYVVNPFKLKKRQDFVKASEFDAFADNYGLLSAEAKKIKKDMRYPAAGMVFWNYWIPGYQDSRGYNMSFTSILRELNDKYRVPAAHAKQVSKEDAAACCRIMGITEAHKDINSVAGALKILLWLTAPLDEPTK